VSVVIPHYNDLDQLAHCLESLRRQRFSRDGFEPAFPGWSDDFERVCLDFCIRFSML
jgi:GT2 family glycosyltransferase